jgi:hypothetical protein
MQRSGAIKRLILALADPIDQNARQPPRTQGTPAQGGLRSYKYRLGTPASRAIPDLLKPPCRRGVRPELSFDFSNADKHIDAEREFISDGVSERNPNAVMPARGAELASGKALVARCPSIYRAFTPPLRHVAPPLLAV